MEPDEHRLASSGGAALTQAIMGLGGAVFEVELPRAGRDRSG